MTISPFRRPCSANGGMIVFAVFVFALIPVIYGQCEGDRGDFSVQYGSQDPSFVVSHANGSCYCAEFVGRQSGDGSALTNLTAQPDVAALLSMVAAQAAQITSLTAQLNNRTGGGSCPQGGVPALTTAPNAAMASATTLFTTSSTSMAPVPGLSVTITTSGYPVLVMAMVDITLSTTGLTSSFSIFRNGSINLGLANGLGQVTDNGYANDVQWGGIMAIDNAPPAGTHTYSYHLAVSAGNAKVQAQSTTPSIMAIEINKDNVNWGYATSTTLTTFSAQAWTAAAGLSFNLFIGTAGSPVLLFANVPWMCISTIMCWTGFSFLRGGTEISGTTYGYGINVGTLNGVKFMSSFVAMDFPPRGYHTYAYANKVGEGTTGASRTNNDQSKAWVAGIELSKLFSNWGYATYSATTTAGVLNSWVPMGTLSTSLLTTGGGVFVFASIDHNTYDRYAVIAYTLFRDGVNLGGANGLTLCNANNQMNEVCDIMYLDTPPAGKRRLLALCSVPKVCCALE
eukprot:TRINITY_DN1331_c0_g2_i1.p1 TRINITY_DN1331_c0_g2~~TRINITY_DN1331_c0_g2_i1.p1  ORF type:complete len:511 (+),score=111.10 TRINITY_DN1331_c0_g2_i1:48-1580(+)